jgi:hypothetical protein
LDRDALDFAWQPFEDVIEEALPLLKRHYAELGLDGEPFNPNWRALFFMASVQKDLRIVTARDDGRLVGYCAGLRVKYLASQEVKVIMVNAIYLEDTYRGSLVPIKIFLGMMIEFAREEGAIRLEMAPQGRHRKGIGRMLRYLGWASSPDPAWILEV